jgi:hypothetical protein
VVHSPSPSCQKYKIYNAGEKGGLSELQTKLLDLALDHPRIGNGQTKVPRSFAMLQAELEEHKLQTPYLKWNEYAALASTIGIQNT